MNRLAVLIPSAIVLVAGSAAVALAVGFSGTAKGSTCVLIDGYGGLTGTDDATLMSLSPHEKRLTCKADPVSNKGEKTTWYDANHNPFSASGEIIPCFDGSGGITEYWREVIKPSREAILQCYFKTK